MIRRSHKRVILGSIFVIGFLTVLFFGVGRFFAGLEDKRRYEEEKADLKPRPLNLYTVKAETRSRARDYAADVLPWQEAKVAAQASGSITILEVERGDVVKKDAVLAELDRELVSTTMRAAEVRYSETERLLREAELLAKRNVASKTEFEASRAREAVSAAELAQARETFDRHIVKAPFDGVVNDRHADVGDAVGVGAPIVTLVDLSRLRVVFYVNEYEINSFKPGQKLDLKINSLPRRIFEPEVKFVTRSADMQTRLFRVEATIPGGEEELRGGMQGIVRATVKTYKDTVFVPVSGVRLSGDKVTALLHPPEGEPTTVKLEIGPEVDGYYPVFVGLKDGDVVVIR